ncbi:MAG: thiamine pyrophosphate-binding protein, partial [Candidatus Margulisiibacteriota bacterium]
MNKIVEHGVRHIFMVTGRGALFLTDAVAANPNLTGVCVHHEQSAAYAAVAYADYQESLGACLVSTGCAGTNALTGVLNAWQDGLPCIFISGQNKVNETSYHTGIPLRTFGQQEANLIPIVQSITKYSVMITDPNDIAYEMDKAIHLAQSGRKGPVWIDIPLDIQNKRIAPQKLHRFIPKKENLFEPIDTDIEYLINAINDSSRPSILIGSGIRSSNAIDVFHELIEKTNIPVTYSNAAPDIFGAEHPFSIGSVGAMGCSRAGNFTVQNSDLLIVLGSRLSSMTTGEDHKTFARAAKVIVVDIDSVEHTKQSIKIDRLIISDAKQLIEVLLNREIKKTNQKWVEQCFHWKKIFPYNEKTFQSDRPVDLYFLSECLTKELPEDAVVVSDSGLIELILPTNISFKRNQRCIHPASQGSMGFALPGLIGAYYASSKPILSVIGDGSVMMNLQELETIRYNKIPAKIFIINNNAYAVIRKRQIDLFRTRTIGVDPSDGISCPDFNKVANAFDIPYLKINTSEELSEKLNEIMSTDGPLLCEIMGEVDQNYIHISYTIK